MRYKAKNKIPSDNVIHAVSEEGEKGRWDENVYNKFVANNPFCWRKKATTDEYIYLYQEIRDFLKFTIQACFFNDLRCLNCDIVHFFLSFGRENLLFDCCNESRHVHDFLAGIFLGTNTCDWLRLFKGEITSVTTSQWFISTAAFQPVINDLFFSIFLRNCHQARAFDIDCALLGFQVYSSRLITSSTSTEWVCVTISSSVLVNLTWL